MGGLGSGRTGRRPVVENGLILDSCKFKHGGYSSGSHNWTNVSTGELIASVGYTVDYHNMTMKLEYSTTIDGKNQMVIDSIPLTIQNTNFCG